MLVDTFWWVMFWKKYGKTDVLQLFYSRIGEILHGWLWPDWALYILKVKDVLQMTSNSLY